MEELRACIQEAEKTHRLSEDACAALLASAGIEEELAAAADRVRAAVVGEAVHLRGLIEFSNICRQNCCYCGLRRDNKELHRFRLSEQEILRLAGEAAGMGYRTVVLQSGEDMHFTAERLARIVRGLKELGVAVTLSVGERPYEDYAVWREAGADRYLLRIETTDAELYERLDPGMSYAGRVRCLQDLRALGYEVGTGSLIGLPGQTVESLARDILFFRELDADMLGLGPLIPNPATPLGTAAPGDLHLTRRMVSLCRLLLPEANIPATTAVETMQSGARELFLRSGANVVMPSVTEGAPRRDYALYPGKACADDAPGHCRHCMSARIRRLGRTVGEGRGSRVHRMPTN